MQLKVIFSLDELFVPVSLFILSLAISVVVTIRQRQFNIATILFNIVTSALIAFGSHLLLTYTGFTLLAVSAYTLLLFYIFNAILHHRLEGSLSKEILLEYLTLLLLGLVLLQGLF
jgi:hypothetical protein